MSAKFEIVRNERDRSSYMEGDCDYTWAVVSVETGDELARFHGDWSAGPNHDRYNGVRAVVLDGNTVVATSEGGAVERVELPVRVALVEDGEAIELLYAGGRVERRERLTCMFFATSGRPFVGHPLVRR